MAKRMTTKQKWAQYEAEQLAQAGKPEFGNGDLTPANLKVGDKVRAHGSCYIPDDQVGVVKRIRVSDDAFLNTVWIDFAAHAAEFGGELCEMNLNGTRFLSRVA